jgi:peptidoglycan/xylan/chitin deacetylase (PgdA/CDA1 family)
VSVYGQRGLLLRLVYLVIALIWWGLTGFGRIVRPGAITLCYHAVTAPDRDRFERQMRLIARRAVTVEAVDRTSPSIGRRPRIAVTFDDAFGVLAETALPICERYGVPVTVFAVTGNLGAMPRWSIQGDHPDASERTMTAIQLRDIARSRLCRIGSHTHTHPDMTTVAPDRARQELAESKRRLESITSTPIDDLALPYGAGHGELITLARCCGYRRVFLLDAPERRRDPTAVERMKMSADAWPIEFWLTSIGAYGWLPPLRRLVRSVRRTRIWRSNGSESIEPVAVAEGR